MAPNESGPIIQHAIQLAIAPVFLLTGIASLLGVMANRLARMVALVAGLTCFLREVYLATHSIRIDADRFRR